MKEEEDCDEKVIIKHSRAYQKGRRLPPHGNTYLRMRKHLLGKIRISNTYLLTAYNAALGGGHCGSGMYEGVPRPRAYTKDSKEKNCAYQESHRSYEYVPDEKKKIHNQKITKREKKYPLLVKTK